MLYVRAKLLSEQVIVSLLIQTLAVVRLDPVGKGEALIGFKVLRPLGEAVGRHSKASIVLLIKLYISH